MTIDGRQTISEVSVIWVMSSGERRPGRIALCAPEPEPAPYETTWGCWCCMDGFWPSPIKVRGEGSMQPLLLALELIAANLRGLVAQGDRVVDPDDGTASSVFMFLRRLMRPSGEPPPVDPVLAEIDAELAESARRYEDASRSEE